MAVFSGTWRHRVLRFSIAELILVKVFCTVGSQLPFERLVQTVAAYADENKEIEVFYQLGNDSQFTPDTNCCETLTADEYAQKINWADLLVSHAGMGSILTALTNSKPILVMPRNASLGEHRNDHQLHTANALGSAGIVTVAKDEEDLAVHLKGLVNLEAHEAISPLASAELIERVQNFVRGRG